MDPTAPAPADAGLHQPAARQRVLPALHLAVMRQRTPLPGWAGVPRGGGWGTAPTASLGSWLVLWDERPSDKIKAVMTARPEPGDAPGVIKKGRAHSHQGNGIKKVFKAVSFILWQRQGDRGALGTVGFWGAHPSSPPTTPSSALGHPKTWVNGSSHCPTSHLGQKQWGLCSCPLEPPRHRFTPACGGGTVWDIPPPSWMLQQCSSSGSVGSGSLRITGGAGSLVGIHVQAKEECHQGSAPRPGEEGRGDPLGEPLPSPREGGEGDPPREQPLAPAGIHPQDPPVPEGKDPPRTTLGAGEGGGRDPPKVTPLR